MTYYKYAERDAESRVNWGDVSKKWSDAIVQGEVARETKRQEIQTLTDQLTDSIINAPMGDNEGINGWYADYAETASEYLLDANRRLKAGNIKVRDYSTIMANITQGTERMTGLAKDFSDNYAIKMERLQNDQSQQAELKMMELAEGFANFTNTMAVVNPTNGMINIAKKGTGETVTIPQMRSYITMQYDRYNVDEAMGSAVDQLAKIEKVIMDERGIKTREAARQMEDDEGKSLWNRKKNNILDAELQDGLHVSSILTEEIGGYNVVTDATNVGENDILFILDPRQPSAGYRVPLYNLDLENMTEEELDMVFSADLDDEERAALIKQAEEQKNVARGWLDTDLMSRLDEKETARADTGRTGLTDEQRKAQARQRNTGTALGHWMNLAYAPTAEQKNASAARLQGQDYVDELGNRQTIVGVDPSENSVVLTLRDANGQESVIERFYETEQGQYSPTQWAQAGSIFFEDPAYAEGLMGQYQDPNREGGPRYADGGMTLTTPGTQRAYTEVVEEVDITPFAEAKVGKDSAPSYFTETATPGNAESEAAATTAAVQSVLGAMGIDASGIAQITESMSEEAGASALGYKEKEVVRFHIPGVTEQSIFIPNNQQGIQALSTLMQMLPELINSGTMLTLEEANDMFSNVPYYNDYNGEKFGKKMREEFGVVSSAPARSTSNGRGGARRAPR